MNIISFRRRIKMHLFVKFDRNTSESELLNNNNLCLMKFIICKTTHRPGLAFQQESSREAEDNLTHPGPKVGDIKELMI